MEKNGLICFILLWIVSACSDAFSCDMQIPHGDVTSWCNTSPCPYSCHEGYEKHDEVSWLICSTSGQWVLWLRNRILSAKDICTPKPCPTVIPKGTFSAECQAVVGSSCRFSCYTGYMRGTSVSELTCQTSTEWSPDLRSLCLRPDGQQCPYYILRGSLNLTCIREPGQTCSFTCDEGYHPSISPSTISCESNLKWNHNPESLCQETICPKFFEGGYVSESCSRKYNATCYEFQCDSGYIKPAFAYSVKCDESGKWIYPYDMSPACVNTYNMFSSSTFRTTFPAAKKSTPIFPTLWKSKSYFNVSRSTDERSGNGNLGTIVGTIVGTLTAILIIFLFIGWLVKRSSVQKSQRRETGGMESGCLRPRENPLQDITTIRQQPNTNGTGSMSSFESPSYNGIYIHPILQRIPTISSSCSYSDPPPSYSKIPIAPNEAPPTYEEVVSDHYRFNLYN